MILAFTKQSQKANRKAFKTLGGPVHAERNCSDLLRYVSKNVRNWGCVHMGSDHNTSDPVQN